MVGSNMPIDAASNAHLGVVGPAVLPAAGSVYAHNAARLPCIFLGPPPHRISLTPSLNPFPVGDGVGGISQPLLFPYSRFIGVITRAVLGVYTLFVQLITLFIISRFTLFIGSVISTRLIYPFLPVYRVAMILAALPLPMVGVPIRFHRAILAQSKEFVKWFK